ncbi:PEP-utilizing enzyme [Patescibacteria group bacterium]
MKQKTKPFHYFARDLQVSVFPQYMIVDLWNKGFTRFHGTLVGLGIANREKVQEYFIRPKEWQRFQKFFHTKVQQDRTYMVRMANKATQAVRRLNTFSQKQIWQKDLTKLSNKQLGNIYQRFIDLDIPCYAYGNIIFTLEFGEGAYFSPKVKEVLLQRAPTKVQQYFSVLAGVPKRTIFYDQSLDMLEVSNRISKHPKMRKLFLTSSPQMVISILKGDYPGVYKEFQRQQKKYHWLFHNWEGPEMAIEDFVLFAKDIVKKGRVSNILHAKKNELVSLQKKQKKIMNKLSFTPHERWLLKMAQFAMWFQPLRKAGQFKSCWHLSKYFKEVGKRLHISADQVRFLTHREVVKALQTGKIDIDEINRRRRLFIYHYVHGKPRILTGETAEKFINKNIHIPQVKKKNTVHGMPACRGMTRGAVRIVNSLKQAEHFKKGEILVSYATNPLLVATMRKAGAILTEEGGMTCHAAIVARELNVPCVVGIPGIVEMFKDGDKISVDAGKGIVKRT